MVKITGTQTIPSDWLLVYQATLTPVMPNGHIRQRYPFELPHSKSYGSKCTQKQLDQREKFLGWVDEFKNLSSSDRAKWYTAPINLIGLTNYYNYYMMSARQKYIVLTIGGLGVIKSIKTKVIDILSGTAEGSTTFDAVDVDKTFFQLVGGSFIVAVVDLVPVAIPVSAYISEYTSTTLKVKWSNTSYAGVDTNAGSISVQIIEYI